MHSLYFKLAGLLLAAVAVSGLFFVVINYAGEQMITKIFSDSSHIEKLSEAYIQDLQDYIDETKAASNDSEKLTEWVRKQKIVSIQVYKDEILTYDSNYPDAAVEDAEAEGAYYEWEYYYTAEFADGTADVFLYGFFSYLYLDSGFPAVAPPVPADLFPLSASLPPPAVFLPGNGEVPAGERFFR